MTGNHKLASRYARAIGELAHEAEALDQVQQELGRLAEAIRGDERFRLVVQSERVPAATKQELLLKVAGENCHRLTRLFVQLVVRKRRAEHLDKMYDAFVAFADQLRGVVEVEITSATALHEDDVSKLADSLGKYTGKQVRIKNVVEPKVMGGVIARVGDLIIDGSVARQLERLKETLQEARLGTVG